MLSEKKKQSLDSIQRDTIKNTHTYPLLKYIYTILKNTELYLYMHLAETRSGRITGNGRGGV